MIQFFLYIGLPYIAIASVIFGTFYRMTKKEHTVSSLSSQFLEGKYLLWGSVPWHFGIVIIFFGHLIPFLFPSLWGDLVAHQTFLITIELIGFLAAILCAIGLLVLLVRRILTRTLQKVNTPADFIVNALLLTQILLGMLTAYHYQYGSVWATGTLYTYVRSLFLLQPDASFMQDMPMVIQFHVVVAWLIILLIPFTRLIHMFTIPIEYFMRAPQKVVWNNERRWRPDAPRAQFVNSRRYFFKGVAGILGAGGLLSIGVMEKMGRYFQGVQKDEVLEAALLEKRLNRMKLTMEEKTYELERLQNSSIYIADLKDLQQQSGKYFIDYEMKPALAFKNSEGLPNLISAKCTHLGCTVGKDVDSNGNILCPCHVSYFNITTGIPTAGSPTQVPLHHIPWEVRDNSGMVVAGFGADGKAFIASGFDSKKEEGYKVYIVKPAGGMA